MSETPKPTSEQYQIPKPAEPQENDADFGNPFVGRGLTASDKSISENARAAERFIQVTEANARETHIPVHHNEDAPDRSKSRMSPKAKVGAAVGIVAAVAAGPAVVDHFNGPEFSEETTTYTVEPGDGLYDVAEAINGIDRIDVRDAVDHISSDPANIAALKDGLQPGESIVIPTDVEP